MDFNVSNFWQQYYAEEKPNYTPFDSYLDKFREERRDLLKFLPAVIINTFPLNGNRGLYGWTYREKSGEINIREDLEGKFRTEVIIHEAIHTFDEYQTRCLTAWIMESMNPVRKRYQKSMEYRI